MPQNRRILHRVKQKNGNMRVLRSLPPFTGTFLTYFTWVWSNAFIKLNKKNCPHGGQFFNQKLIFLKKNLVRFL